MTAPYLPMLASQSKEIAPSVDAAIVVLSRKDHWLYDVKWDGIRCIAHIVDGVVKLINRRDANITFRYPEVVSALSSAFHGQTLILDGEIQCFVDGEPSFANTHRRDAQQSKMAVAGLVTKMPASYVVFDLLQAFGDDIRGLGLEHRLRMLDEIVWPVVTPPASHVLLRSQSGTDANVMWDMVTTRGLEGLIAKRLTSRYYPGRQNVWVKLKPVKSITAVVSGYDLGDSKGKFHRTMGALHLAVVNDAGELVHIGKVGSGFTGKERDELRGQLDSDAVLLVEVEYQDIGSKKTPQYPLGQLRFPVYKHLRTDLTILDCSYEQL